MNTQALLAGIEERLTLDTLRLQRHKALFNGIFAYYNEPIEAERLGWYAAEMMPYAPDRVEWAMNVWRRTARPTNQKPRAPLPEDLLPYLTETVSIDAQASEMAADIFTALTIGYNHADRAQAKLGPVAWLVVQRLGGWTALCRDCNTHDKHTFHAQVRDMAKGQLQRQQRSGVAAPCRPAQGARIETARTPTPLPQVEPRRLAAPSVYTAEIDAMVAQVLSKNS